jgi:ParB family chromosome partitioning protein
VDDPATRGMSTASPLQDLRELPLEELEPNLSQPRQYFDEAALDALAGSIGKRGVLQPVLVRSLEDGKYEIIVGERRWRAAMIAGLQRIPALVCPFDDEAALEAALIENMAREDLTPVEEARACVTLAQEFGLTYLQIGDRVGRGKSVVSNLVRLLNLSEDLLELLDRGLLSKSQGIVLLMAQDQKSRRELARAAIEKHWTVGTLEARVRESNADQPRSREGSEEVGSEGQRERDAGQARDPEQERNPTTMDVARVWGDVLGVAVRVRTLRTRKVRLEVEFPSIEAALAWGGHLGKAVARGSKRR